MLSLHVRPDAIVVPATPIDEYIMRLIVAAGMMMKGKDAGARIVYPVLHHQHMFAEIKVVEAAVWLRLLGPAYDEWPEDAVATLHARVRMPEMRAGIVSRKAVAECGMRRDGALSDVRHAIHIGRLLLVQAMPMDRGALAQQIILDIDDNLIALAHLYRWAGHHAIDHGDATLQSIAHDAVRPRAVGQIEWTVVAGLREGLIPFDHEGVVARHGWRTRLTVAQARMLAIPFGCPDI